MSPSSPLRSLATAAVAAAVLTACEVPSGVPQWDTTWNVPSQALTVGVSQVLPNGVSLAPDGASFQLSVAPVTITQRLASDCAPCAALNGYVAPKPAFVSRHSTVTELPASVTAGMLAAGTTVDVRVVNNQTFDPLRPAGAAGGRGYLKVVVRSGDLVLARDSVDGATAELPAYGGVLVRRLTLGGGTVGAQVHVEYELSSPAGVPTLIDVDRTVVVTATPAPLRVSQARVTVQDAQVAQSTTTDLDVSEAIADRVRGGRLLVDVRDPIGVRGALRVRITASGVDFTKALDVTGGDKAYAIAFSREEFQAMFGRTVTFTFSGPVSSGGAITLTPALTMQIGTRFELVISSNS